MIYVVEVNPENVSEFESTNLASGLVEYIEAVDSAEKISDLI